MERTAVTSSNIASVGYEAETMTLEIEFNNGRVYQYQGVPQEVYEALIQAGSKGSYFNANIKNSYSCTRL